MPWGLPQGFLLIVSGNHSVEAKGPVRFLKPKKLAGPLEPRLPKANFLWAVRRTRRLSRPIGSWSNPSDPVKACAIDMTSRFVRKPPMFMSGRLS